MVALRRRVGLLGENTTSYCLSIQYVPNIIMIFLSYTTSLHNNSLSKKNKINNIGTRYYYGHDARTYYYMYKVYHSLCIDLLFSRNVPTYLLISYNFTYA